MLGEFVGGSGGIRGRVLVANGLSYVRLNSTCSDILGGSIWILTMKNYPRGGGPEVLAVYRNRIRGVVKSSTTSEWLQMVVSLRRYSGELSA